MNSRQLSIIIGSILGDSYINPSGGMVFAGSDKHQDYIEWKQSELQDIGAAPIRKYTRHDKRYDTTYVMHRFYLGKQKRFRSWFYPEGTKIIPLDLKLDSLAFAVWFLDDGHLVSGSGFSIATCGFPDESIQRAMQLVTSLGIQCRATKDKRLYISAASKSLVLEFVKPIIVPSMRHKILVRPDAHLVGKVEKICPSCNRPFLSYESAHQTYCNRKCAGVGRPSGYKTRTKTDTCPICGNEFLKYSKNQVTCPSCKQKPFSHETCFVCGEPVRRRGNKCCSGRCATILGHIVRGHNVTAIP
jgi:hypothetical protein